MARTVDVFKIFIASPGGLEAERQAIREEIDSFNRVFMHDTGIEFAAEGWEDVPGGLRRPQELINQSVRACDYMVLVLGSRWGTRPSADGDFTSGTEEEFHVARQCIAQAESPMADILVLFKGVPEDQLSDPGEQLRKVVSFKEELEESRQLLYKTFDSVDGLRAEVSIRLQSWARDRAKAGRDSPQLAEGNAEAIPASKPSHDETRLGSVDEVPGSLLALRAAEDFEAKGLMTQAEAAYAKAVVDSDVVSLEKYARFLRRTGRLSKSLEINRAILSQLASSESASTTTVERARILANIGIIERKLGDLRASRYSLHEAVQTARQGGDDAVEVLTYALDNLGITAKRAGDASQAADCFRQALAVRQQTGDTVGQARTLTNLARLEKRLGEVARAQAACSEAIDLLLNSDDQAPLAAAHATMGEILESQGDLVGAERSYKKALQINETLGMPDNIAMSLSQVARILMESGDLPGAERYAQRSLEENERTSNREGLVGATHLLGRIFGETGREALAIKLLQEASAAYAQIGNPNGEAWALWHLAELQRRAGQGPEGTQAVHRARSLASAMGNARLLALIEESM